MNWLFLLLIWMVVNLVDITIGQPICPRICGVEHKHKTHKVNKCPQDNVCIHKVRK